MTLLNAQVATKCATLTTKRLQVLWKVEHDLALVPVEDLVAHGTQLHVHVVPLAMDVCLAAIPMVEMLHLGCLVYQIYW